jgi:hypothetical protein
MRSWRWWGLLVLLASATSGANVLLGGGVLFGVVFGTAIGVLYAVLR